MTDAKKGTREDFDRVAAKSAYLVEVGVRGEQRQMFQAQLAAAVEALKATTGGCMLSLALPPGSVVIVNGKAVRP